MKTKTLLTVLVMLLFSSATLVAQRPTKFPKGSSNVPSQNSQSTNLNKEASSSGAYDKSGLPGTKGSAYLNPEFIPGVIAFDDGTQLENKPLRFNLYTQQMQFVENEDTVAIGNPGDVAYIRIEEKVFVYTDYLCNGGLKSGYFELLENGDCRLLKRWSALYHETDQGAGEGEACDVFYRDCQCFMQFFLNPASVVQIKKKDFVLSFANNGDKVQDFMRQDKLKPKNEEDLKKIVDYYNNIN